ncbi:DUF58 domain-containing protein [Halorarius litoreus]|uniref:DUF58 domain-containing protein n=1 Tax=Halorarius litoreus TaxID=2962676 RepID=UPI0020CEDFC1|nr:DUF58 domain-containing protein [Halorarius litoreus]
MRPTRRGYVVLGVAIAAIALAAHSGPRSLNAVAGPALVTLAYGVVSLARRPDPTVSRGKPAPGFPGETRTIPLTVQASGPATVRDRTGSGVAPVDDAERYVSGDGKTSYEIELLARGEHDLGPTEIVQRDTLGVVARETVARTTTPALVYPVVEPIAPNRTFQGLVERAGSADRDAFDTLREYVPGDPLRDVHWTSSAKREAGDLVVAEFAREDEGGLTLVAEGDTGYADEMASAAASIAVHLLAMDLEVEVYAPDGHVRKGRGDQHRDELLELLARTPAGRVGDVAADVRIRADAEGVHVTANGSTFPFAELLGGGYESADARDATTAEVSV